MVDGSQLKRRKGKKVNKIVDGRKETRIKNKEETFGKKGTGGVGEGKAYSGGDERRV